MDSIDNPTPPPEQQASSDREAEIEALIASARSVVQERQKPWERVLLPIIIVVFLAVIGFGAYWQFLRGKASPAHTTTKSSAQAAAQQSSPNVPTQSYTSPDFNLSFNYPDGWAVVDSGSGPMTVTSPGMRLTSATGQTVTGQVTMTIQKQGQLPASFSAGPALAVLNSQTITYTQPTASQTSQTYLSFVQYSSTTARGGLDAIYLTGNDGYQKDQTIPASDVAGVNPLVVVTFTKCGNAICTSNLTPLTIASASWSKSALQASVITMLVSLAFQ